MAFSGKTQYLALMNAGASRTNQHKSVPSGRQAAMPQVSTLACCSLARLSLPLGRLASKCAQTRETRLQQGCTCCSRHSIGTAIEFLSG